MDNTLIHRLIPILIRLPYKNRPCGRLSKVVFYFYDNALLHNSIEENPVKLKNRRGFLLSKKVKEGDNFVGRENLINLFKLGERSLSLTVSSEKRKNEGHHSRLKFEYLYLLNEQGTRIFSAIFKLLAL